MKNKRERLAKIREAKAALENEARARADKGQGLSGGNSAMRQEPRQQALFI